MLNSVMSRMPMLQNGLQVDLNCRQMALGITMFENTFLDLQTDMKTHDICH